MAVTLDNTPDFGGWATRAGLECADGLTIGTDAFKDMDGKRVPLVYSHGHEDIADVLGHAILEAREEGIYAWCFTNNGDKGRQAKEAVQHDDLTMMSIYANKIQKRGMVVQHGIIREVSLVMAGANPGAVIDFVSVRHSDGGTELLEDEAVITMGEYSHLQHSDLDAPVREAVENSTDDEDDPEAVWETMTPAQKSLVELMLTVPAEALGEEDPEEDPDNPEDPEASDNGEGTNEDPSNNADAAPEAGTDGADTGANPADGVSAPDAAPDAAAAAHSDDLKGSEMTDTLTHNVFDQAAVIKHGLSGKAKDDKYVLSHSDKQSILGDALSKRANSLKEMVEGFQLSHGIENIDILFPDAKAVSDVPEWVRRRNEWVDRVLSGAKHTPFSRIKSLSADLTLEAARAKGYIKGALKKEEFFAVAKRVTTPQTIYKKQKLDRDDILDITDFDVVVWLKGEMRIMLDEELARAVLISDGRSNADDDKILEDHIRPIATDHELFQTTVYINLGDANSSPEEIVDALLLNRRHYRGSGNPDLFTTEQYISRILNVKDNTGRRIYGNISELASVLRVNSIIPVEVMEDVPDLVAIMVNMVDYTLGTDRGGQVSLFDDFDIDYNQYKYLIEVRCSGALTKTKSALVVRRAADNAVMVTPEAPVWDAAAHTVTVPTTSGVVYKNQSNGAILQHNTPVVLADGQELTVVAVPADSTKYLASNVVDEFRFNHDEGLVEGPF